MKIILAFGIVIIFLMFFKKNSIIIPKPSKNKINPFLIEILHSEYFDIENTVIDYTKNKNVLKNSKSKQTLIFEKSLDDLLVNWKFEYYNRIFSLEDKIFNLYNLNIEEQKEKAYDLIKKIDSNIRDFKIDVLSEFIKTKKNGVKNQIIDEELNFIIKNIVVSPFKCQVISDSLLEAFKKAEVNIDDALDDIGIKAYKLGIESHSNIGYFLRRWADIYQEILIDKITHVKISFLKHELLKSLEEIDKNNKSLFPIILEPVNGVIIVKNIISGKESIRLGLTRIDDEGNQIINCNYTSIHICEKDPIIDINGDKLRKFEYSFLNKFDIIDEIVVKEEDRKVRILSEENKLAFSNVDFTYVSYI